MVVLGSLAVVGIVAPVSVLAQEVEELDPSDIVEPLVAGDDAAFTEPGEPVDIDVTANDSDDSDDADVTISIVADTVHADVSVGVDEAEPFIAVDPVDGFDGVASFDYEACADGSCDTATVRVFVGTSGCTIVGTNGADTLNGTNGDDVICGRAGSDVIEGKGGNDTIFGGRGADTISGNGGSDLIFGGQGADFIDGDAGDDVVNGGRGQDDIRGSAGNDSLYGGRGADIIRGNAGDDLIIGKQGNDDLRGGKGNDVIRGWRGQDTIDGGDDNDTLYGGRGDDTINGGDGDDIVRGRQGADNVSGEAGNDTLFGNRGADTINGGEGIDTVNGGIGQDTCDGEEIVRCENDEPPVDTDPPATTVVSVDELATTGELELSLNAVDPAGIGSVSLLSPNGFVYDVTQDDENNWSALISADRLFAGDIYEFVFVVTDTVGNATLTDAIAVSVPDRDIPAPAVVLEFDDGVPLSELLADMAASGVLPYEFVHSRMVDAVSDLSPELRDRVAQYPGLASDLVGRTHVGVATVNSTPLVDIGGLYDGLYSQQGGIGEPRIVAVRGIAPTAVAATDFEGLAGSGSGVLGDEARSLEFVPAGGEGWKDEPFWPTDVDLQWGASPSFRVDKERACGYSPESCFWQDLFGDYPGVDYEGRYVHGFVSGLDEHFRPYFDEYGDHRAYEFDVAQINLDLEAGDDLPWVQRFPANFGTSELADAVFGQICDPSDGDKFPLDRFSVEATTSHDFAGVEAQRNGYSFTLFETNVNAEAAPYPDSFVGDDCAEMDMSFGIAQPGALDRSLDSFYYSFTAAKGSVDVTGLAVEHQSLDQHPSDDEDGVRASVKGHLCESWSAGGAGTFAGVLGTNFCTGVVVGKTRSVTVLANTDDVRQNGFEVPATVPWMLMDFTGDGYSRACFELATPPDLYDTTTYFRVSENGGSPTTVDRTVGFGLGWGLASAGQDCSYLSSEPGGFQIGGSQVLPPLVTGEFYRVQLQTVHDEPATWSILEDPVLRYTDQDEYVLGGLPAGLSLNAGTGVISGVPDLGTAGGPLYVTVKAVDGDRSAVRQVMFEPSTQNIVATVSTVPDPVVAGELAYLSFAVTNEGPTTVSNAGLSVAEGGYFSLGDAVYYGATCGKYPDAPLEHRCDLGPLAPGETKIVQITAVIDLPYWFTIFGWFCTPGSSTAECFFDYQINT